MVEGGMDSDGSDRACTTAMYEKQHKQSRHPFFGDRFHSAADYATYDYSGGKCSQEKF